MGVWLESGRGAGVAVRSCRQRSQAVRRLNGQLPNTITAMTMGGMKIMACTTRPKPRASAGPTSKAFSNWYTTNSKVPTDAGREGITPTNPMVPTMSSVATNTDISIPMPKANTQADSPSNSQLRWTQ